MNITSRIYYHFTAYVPRRLPATPEAYERLKRVLIEAYGVPDEPQIWVLVAGFISSTPAVQLRRAWGEIANAAKRLRINNLAMGHKHQAMQQLNSRLEAAVKAESERLQAEEAQKNDQKEAPEQSQADAGPQPQPAKENAPSS